VLRPADDQQTKQPSKVPLPSASQYFAGQQRSDEVLVAAGHSQQPGNMQPLLRESAIDTGHLDLTVPATLPRHRLDRQRF
jgi:hypothetical protein